MRNRLRTWHRSIGALLALLLLMLSVTGILLNHSHDLKLEQQPLHWPWLLAHYDAADVSTDRVYQVDERVISQFGKQVFVDASPVAQIHKPILGGIHLEEMMVLTSDNALFLLGPDGELIETMGHIADIPSQIQNIGLFHGLPVLQTRHGMWRGNILLEEWEKISLQGVTWSQSIIMPSSLNAELTDYFYGEGISAERFILDLHNGDIVRGIGVWLMDIVAFFLMILSISGLWMWLRPRV